MTDSQILGILLGLFVVHVIAYVRLRYRLIKLERWRKAQEDITDEFPYALTNPRSDPIADHKLYKGDDYQERFGSCED